ncbi:MAG: hypothetical protein ACQESR_19795 [Planctomycetota bacterium]
MPQHSNPENREIPSLSQLTFDWLWSANVTGMKRVFVGIGGPCLIEEGRLTLPRMLREEGYATALFGKWHIGMTFLDKDGHRIKDSKLEGIKRIDYSRPIPDAPIHRGFDRFYGTVSCPTTDWFHAYIDGDRVPVPPEKPLDRDKLPKHPPYTLDCRPGVVAPNFDLEEVDLVFLDKSRNFLEQHVRNHPDTPQRLIHRAALIGGYSPMRRLVQVVILIGFFTLFLYACLPYTVSSPRDGDKITSHQAEADTWPSHHAEDFLRKEFLPAEVFLAIDPLVSISTAIASETWVWSLTFASPILLVWAEEGSRSPRARGGWGT